MKVISTEKFKHISKILDAELFVTNPIYQKILVNHKTLCAEVEDLSFVKFASRDPISLDELMVKRTELKN
jgi:hypothetical protein